MKLCVLRVFVVNFFEPRKRGVIALDPRSAFGLRPHWAGMTSGEDAEIGGFKAFDLIAQ